MADVVNIADARAAKQRRELFVGVLAFLLLWVLCNGGGE